MKYKVSYTVWADHDADADEIRSYVENELSGEDVVVAPVEEEDVPWPPEEGWYLSGTTSVTYWTAGQFDDEDDWDIESRKWFLRNYSHVNPPTPYEAAPAEPKYKDGKYLADGEHVYLRMSGTWYVRNSLGNLSGGFDPSIYTDSDIGDEYELTFVSDW